ncbi:MAG TPA: V-type ATP synthase subunit F [Candidatus Coatesbacteria bacterium]|nr:V-type ATP synthase subunit F [Candidatus Coatesbacteria bacterium]
MPALDKIYFIGELEQLRGFRALGTTVLGVTEPEEAAEALKQAVRDGAVAIFITEELGGKMWDALAAYADRPLPVITLIPSSAGSKGIAFERIRRMVERAVGADVLGKE